MKRPSRSSTLTGTVTSVELTLTTSSSPTSSTTSPAGSGARPACVGAVGTEDLGKGVGAVVAPLCGGAGAGLPVTAAGGCAAAPPPTRRGRVCAGSDAGVIARIRKSRARAADFLIFSAPGSDT
jgi:hypothetical protein